VAITRGFYLGKYEVTQVQYQAVTGADPSKWKEANRPVEQVSWLDAAEFCRKASEKTRREVRLPTEAEWEYACRAGTTGDYAGKLGEMGWCQWSPDTILKTHPVAQKKPNPWGLYDMHGNVWEWVQDVWHTGADGAPTDGSAWLDAPERINRGVVRGGSFFNPPWLLRSYIRMRTPIGCRIHFNNGFRLAVSLRPE
jgi:formylglycine-generating enzyme required for sulfatase activity